MATEQSGTQLNVDMDLDLKRRLQARLVLEGKTIKGWLDEMARQYLGEAPTAPAGKGGTTSKKR